jgi:hypothetical protein
LITGVHFATSAATKARRAFGPDAGGLDMADCVRNLVAHEAVLSGDQVPADYSESPVWPPGGQRNINRRRARRDKAPAITEPYRLPQQVSWVSAAAAR